jgi:hypothetical protein
MVEDPTLPPPDLGAHRSGVCVCVQWFADGVERPLLGSTRLDGAVEEDSASPSLNDAARAGSTSAWLGGAW